MTTPTQVHLRTLTLIVAVLLPQAAAAQTGPAFNVTVTESTELVEAVGTTRRIGRADIDARAARTLDEALRLLPGIYIRTGGDGTPRIDVRGFRSRHVLLLVNGVLVNSTADGQFDPARISTDAIREIKVSYGSSSVLYGDNALAAVIEITTVEAAPDARLHVSAGVPGQGGAGGRYNRTAGNWSVSATASGYTTDAFALPGSFSSTPLEDGGRRLNSDRDRGDVRGAVGYRFSPALSIGSEWSFAAGSYGVPAGTISDSSDIFAQTPRFERVNGYRATAGQISALLAPSSRIDLRVWAFRNSQHEDRARYDDATYSSMDDPLVSGTFDADERTVVTGSSALARVDLGRFGRLRAAVNGRREAFDARGVIRDVLASGGGGGGGGGGRGGGGGGGGSPTAFALRALSTDEHVDVYSSGLEWQANPAPRLGSVIGAAVNVQRRPDGPTVREPTWLAGLAYDATTALRLHGSATRKIRVPSIDQLFNAASGNPSLRAERAYGLDVGADYRIDAASSVGVAGFVTDARDFIERVSGSPFENQDRYRFRGVELTARTAWIPRFDLQGTYTFLHSERVTPDETQLLQTRPRHRGGVQWAWTPAAGSTIRGAAHRTGWQLYDSRGSELVQRRAGGYTLVDVGFTHALGRGYDVMVDVTNVFDRLYEQAYGLPREGRAAVLTLRVRVD